MKIKPTQEMIAFFENRIDKHIRRVQKNLIKLSKQCKSLNPDKLYQRIFEHDASKYSQDEYLPYVYLTWFYKCKNENVLYKYPDGIEDMINEAKEKHYCTNRHHPEYHKNPNEMTDIDIAEMVADWAAMSQEMNNSLKEWVDDNIDKWKFNQAHKNLIYDLIEVF